MSGSKCRSGQRSRTGADLMKSGVNLLNPTPGELVYLGLPNVPGSGNDHIPPSDPANVRKKVGTNFTVTGVELEWEPSTDNNWLSYYQIYRDGEMIDKVAKGTYYFDHSNGPANLAANYQVQAVDGDGNGSRKVEAVQVAGGPVIFTAWGGYLAGKDYSYQGANGWSYEEWADVMSCSDNTGCHWLARPAKMTWNGAHGHMGLYEGRAGTQKASIGASWLHPGDSADAVRIFTVPYSGQITLTGTIHKDIYHTHGDGVRAKVLKGSQQLWPATGWEPLAGDDVSGKKMELKLSVLKGDKLYFVVNDNVNAETTTRCGTHKLPTIGLIPGWNGCNGRWWMTLIAWLPTRGGDGRKWAWAPSATRATCPAWSRGRWRSAGCLATK